MKLVQYPDPILTTPTEPMAFGKEASARGYDPQTINLQLRATVRMAGGSLIGLAANQIGLPYRMCVVGMESGEWITMVNPEITEKGGPMVTATEGCGSLQEPKRLLVDVTRPDQVTVKFQSVSGQRLGIALQGWDARVAQHEIDHLNGIMILEYGEPFVDDSL